MVVDSRAMLAWMQEEPAAEAMHSLLHSADTGRIHLLMSALNVGETFYILAKRRSRPIAEEFLQRLPSLPIRVMVPDQDGILAAARVKAAHPVAYGDSFAISLAQSQRASVITGAEEIRKCALMPVHWIG